MICLQSRRCRTGTPNRSRYHHSLVSIDKTLKLIRDQDLTSLKRPSLSSEIRQRLLRPGKADSKALSETTPNPSVKQGQYRSLPQTNGNGNGAKTSASRRYYASADDGGDWPPELHDYNQRFAKTLEGIKRRHDSVVTTVGERQNWTMLQRKC